MICSCVCLHSTLPSYKVLQSAYERNNNGHIVSIWHSRRLTSSRNEHLEPATDLQVSSKTSLLNQFYFSEFKETKYRKIKSDLCTNINRKLIPKFALLQPVWQARHLATQACKNFLVSLRLWWISKQPSQPPSPKMLQAQIFTAVSVPVTTRTI